MLIDAKGVRGPQLTLGVQTKPELFEQSMHQRAKSWAPRGAKSYRIEWVKRDDCIEGKSNTVTGNGTFSVSYFTTKEEGDHKI